MGWKSLTLRGCGRHSERCFPFHHHKVLCPLPPKQGSRVCCHLLTSSCVAFRTQERVLGCKLPRQARPFTLCLSRHVGMAAQSSPWAALTGFFFVVVPGLVRLTWESPWSIAVCGTDVPSFYFSLLSHSQGSGCP